LVINIKNSGTYFGLLSHHQFKKKQYCTFSEWTHYVVCVNNMGSHNVDSMTVPIPYLYLGWWWFNEPKHVAEFL